MKDRYLKLLKSLLVYWLTGLVIYGFLIATTWLIVFPLLAFVLVREFRLPDITLIKAIGLIIFVAFWVGTITWLKEDVFENHD